MVYVVHVRLFEAFKKDNNGNILDKNVFTEDIKNSIVKINDGSAITSFGFKNISAVKEKDALLAIDNEYLGEIKDILKKRIIKNKTLELHTTEYRPWGSFENIAQGDGF